MNNIETVTPTPRIETTKNAAVWKAAQSLETTFVAEMLKLTGLGKSRESFGGGVGEDQFSSFLTREYAAATVSAGGVGLAESIYESLIKQEAAK